MPSIFNRAFYTSAQVTSPFTISLGTGFTAAPNSVKGYFIIEDADNKAAFANVVATVTGGNTLTVNSIEFTTDGGGGLPTLTGTVNLFSSLPVSKYGVAAEDGQDGILLLGDQNAVGINGTAQSTAGWNKSLDYVDYNVLMYREIDVIFNEGHTLTSNDPEVVDQITSAEDPLPHHHSTGTTLGGADSVGFAMAFAKNYFNHYPAARRPVLIPLASSTASINASNYSTDAERGITRADEFLALNSGNRITGIIISLGITDADLAASAGFEAGFDAMITSQRAQYPDATVVVCTMHPTTVSTIGAHATTIDTSLLDAPNRFSNLAVATPLVGYGLDATSRLMDSAGLRSFGDVIYTSFEVAAENVTL